MRGVDPSSSELDRLVRQPQVEEMLGKRLRSVAACDHGPGFPAVEPVDEPEKQAIARVVVSELHGPPLSRVSDFLRQHDVISAHVDMLEFRRSFAFAFSGIGKLANPALHDRTAFRGREGGFARALSHDRGRRVARAQRGQRGRAGAGIRQLLAGSHPPPAPFGQHPQ